MLDPANLSNTADPPEARWHRVAELLEQARARPHVERDAYVRDVCGPDASLRLEVLTLLEAEATPPGPVDRLLDALSPSGVVPPERTAGDRIGPYELIKVIGRGGMGVVHLARRADGQYERLVALKVASATFVDPRLRERFLAERDILAGLSHPNIATLFDGGVTPEGHPYFTMEYVEGQAIDAHCDRMALDLRARLRLFVCVCDAVAEAHRGLVVHRDLKPTNVFVTTDGRVKLLDFGIAKLLAPDGYQDVAPTTVDGRLMTPEYASPEQVTGRRVSTGTDIYALGLLLYELLCGRRAHRFRSRALGEIHDVVVHADPIRPSDAASRSEADGSAAGSPDAIARARSTTPARLSRMLRGDLDRIVSMALRKEPARRYASASLLADDVERYLTGRPVAARSGSWSYRAVKFVVRHRLALTAAGVLLAGFGGYVVGHVGLARRHADAMQQAAERARIEAQKSARVSGLLTGILTGTDPYASQRRQWPTVREIVDAGAERIRTELVGEPELQAEMSIVIGRTYQRLGAYDRAQALLDEALSIARGIAGPDHVLVARALNDLGALNIERGNYPVATKFLEEALGMRRRLLGNEHADVAATLVELGRVYTFQGAPRPVEPLFSEALAIRRTVLGDAHKDTASSKSDLGLALYRKGDLARAEVLFRQALETNRAALGDEHPDVGASWSNLGLVLAGQGHHEEAEALFRRTLSMRRRAVGDAHPTVALTLQNLGNALRAQQRLDEALTAFDEAHRIARTTLGDEHPTTAMCMTSTARVHLDRGEPRRAEPLLRQALAIRQRLFRNDDGRVAATKGLLGEALTSLGRYEEAERLLLDAHGALADRSESRPRDVRESVDRLVRLYSAWGRPVKAAHYRELAARD